MDFKRPTEHSGHDIDAQFEQSYKPEPTPKPLGNPSEVTNEPPRVVEKKHSRLHKFVTSFLLILLLVATGYAVYAYMNEQSLRNDLTAANEQKDNLTTLNSALTNKLSDLKADEATDTTTTDDKALIVKTVTASANAPAAAKDKKVTVTVLKQGKEFTTAATGWQTQDDMVYVLKKVGDTWTVVHSGGTVIPKETITQFAIPTEYQTFE